MTENSTRSSKEPTPRFQKSTSLNNGRCDTPDSAGSRTGSGSPVPANVAAGSPTSTTSSGAVPANSPTSAHNSNLNHAGSVSQRPFSHRGRYGGYGHAHHAYYGGRPNQHTNYHQPQCRPSSPPFSKPLLDFMMSQWQTFEISLNRREHALADDGPPASPRLPGPANSPYRQPRHSHQGGGWNTVNRRFSDNGHHVNHTDAGDFQSSSGDMGSSGRRFRGPGAHNTHPHQFANNEQPWQRGHVVGRRKSPNGLSNRASGPRSTLPFAGPAPGPHHHHQYNQQQQQQAQSGDSASSPTPPSTDQAASPVDPAPAGGAKSTDGQAAAAAAAESASSSGVVSKLPADRLTGTVAPTKTAGTAAPTATAAPSKGRVSPRESQAQRQNGSSAAAAPAVGLDTQSVLPSSSSSAAAVVLPVQLVTTQADKAINADQSEEKIQAGPKKGTPTSHSVCAGGGSGDLSPPGVVFSSLAGGRGGGSSRPIPFAHTTRGDDGRGRNGGAISSSSTDNCSVLRAVAESLPAAGSGRPINRYPASARAESISISIGSSSFGSLDQGDALSGGDQFWTPDPPSSPVTAGNVPVSPNAGASAASSSSSSAASSAASSQFFQNASGPQNAPASSSSPGSSPLVERAPPTAVVAAFEKPPQQQQQQHHSKQRVSTAPIR